MGEFDSAEPNRRIFAFFGNSQLHFIDFVGYSHFSALETLPSVNHL